ncbi:ribonuclease Z [Luteimicrobium sp. DT211]|uniref:ribonuclease Z n=1 Tax=Luteimicrobium sp. DT211 TaxID=3393412 RepID=UPI003CF0F78E
MSARELVVLGTASMVPTRDRNHNGYLLRWDDAGILFDPGEGTQRQMTRAGVSASSVTRIALTHLHGDHALGLPGVVQRLSLDQVPDVVPVCFPASGAPWVERLVDATVYHRAVELELQPLVEDGPVPGGPGPGARTPLTLTARRLDHTIDAFGYRVDEPDGRRLLPERLADVGLSGPAVGRLVADGVAVGADGRTVRVEDVSEVRRGQSAAFVMDTRVCDAAYALADGVDLLVIESTFLERDADAARHFGHLTARQAGTVAAESGARSLVLTHFSQRYSDPVEYEREAREVFAGTLTVARDLDRVPVPRRRSP